MREGAAIGIPKISAATSAARPISPGAGAIGTVDVRRHHQGLARRSHGRQPCFLRGALGQDMRRGGTAFANQIIMGYGAAARSYGHDGWLTNGGSGAAAGS